MQVKMLRQKIVNGESVRIGEVVNTNDLDAKLLIGMGAAEYYTPPKPKTKRKARKHV